MHVKGSFSVDVYIDLNGQWVSGNKGSKIVWELEQQDLKHGDGNEGLKTWRIRRETEPLFSEYQDQAEWGSLYFTAPLVGPYSLYSLPTF